MKPKLFYLLSVLAFIITVNCIVFESLKLINTASVFRAILFPVFFLIYFSNDNFISKAFTLFLLFFGLAEVSYLINYIDATVAYYAGIVFYVFAYSMLFLHLISRITIKTIKEKYMVQVVSLVVFSIYLLVALDTFFLKEYDGEMNIIARVIENVYNLLLLLVLVFSLINFLSNKTLKTLMLFIACACLVFSELVQITVYLTEDNEPLTLVYSLMLIFGFYFFYMYINKTDILANS